MDNLTEQLETLRKQEEIIKSMIKKLQDQKQRLEIEELDLNDLIRFLKLFKKCKTLDLLTRTI